MVRSGIRAVFFCAETPSFKEYELPVYTVVAALDDSPPPPVQIRFIERFYIELGFVVGGNARAGSSIRNRIGIPRVCRPCRAIWLLRDIPHAHEVVVVLIHPVHITGVVKLVRRIGVSFILQAVPCMRTNEDYG